MPVPASFYKWLSGGCRAAMPLRALTLAIRALPSVVQPILEHPRDGELLLVFNRQFECRDYARTRAQILRGVMRHSPNCRVAQTSKQGNPWPTSLHSCYVFPHI